MQQTSPGRLSSHTQRDKEKRRKNIALIEAHGSKAQIAEMDLIIDELFLKASATVHSIG